MKISYRSHPVMTMLNSGRLEKFKVHQSDVEAFKKNMSIIDDIEYNFNLLISDFKSNIQIITSPFFDAIELAKPKLVGDDIFRLEKPECGAVFFPNGYVFLYYVDKFTIGESLNKMILIFNNEFLVSYSISKKESNLSNTYIWKTHIDRYQQANPKASKNELIEECDRDFFTLLMCTISFIKYCPIETVHLKPNSKTKQFNCKYINDTGNNIRIYDSKWFTTFVKSDAFLVRSHLRWQPKKKDGEWTKELILIEEFMKNGYTAPAKKLAQA